MPSYIRAEQRDRGTFLRAIYRRYRGADLAAFQHFVDTSMAPHILNRLSPDAVRRIREHRAAGHTTILITGVVRPLTRPLEPLFDVIVAADLAVDDEGRCTGFLTGPPLVGESRAAWLKHYASLHDVDLKRSFAYADSHSDLPMLETVGNAVAVTPGHPADAGRRAKQWSVVEWKIKPITAGRRTLATSRSLSDARKSRQPHRQMLALEMYRSLPKYVAARTMGRRMPGILTGPAAPLRLISREQPRRRPTGRAGPGWRRGCRASPVQIWPRSPAARASTSRR